ncbi:MAG TPA: dihydropteroate synthase DHPS, partial [Nitrospiria bacterium]|nr:dihydropteroate synthase DHPS [Nitrospiria bacterium]
NIYLDPLILAINCMQDQAKEGIRAIKLFQEINDPPMKTSVGLSNISNGCPKELREIINRTYLSLLIYEGLTAAIADPTDKALMDVVKTTEMLLGKRLYAHSFLDL